MSSLVSVLELWAGLAVARFVSFVTFLMHCLTQVLQSSLTLALLRCIFIDGEVLYDGMPTTSINLDALRSHITIIPQAVSQCSPSSLRITYAILPA